MNRKALLKVTKVDIEALVFGISLLVLLEFLYAATTPGVTLHMFVGDVLFYFLILLVIWSFYYYQRGKMEESLRESEKKYRVLYETTRDGLVATDMDGRIVECNQAYVGMLGYSKDELKNLTYQQLTPKKWHRMEATIAKEQIMKRGYSDEYEKEYRRKDGTVFPISIRVWLIRGEDGKPKGMWAIIRDITERKKLEEKLLDSSSRLKEEVEERNKLIHDYSKLIKELCCIYGISKLVENPAVSLEDILQETVNLLPPAWRYSDITCARIVFEGQEFRTENFKKTRWKQQADIKVHGKKVGVLEIYYLEEKPALDEGPFTNEERDLLDAAAERLEKIAELKKAEEKLKEYAEHLEEMVEERTRQLKEAQERLIKAERLATVGEVASMVGHDLRNPLTGMAGAAYYLKTKADSKLDEKMKEMLELIERDIEYSNRIVENLLEYSKDIQPELTETDLKSLVDGTLTLVKVPKNIRILDLTKSETKIKVDAHEITRVFVNLIKNAIDSMPEGGKLSIKSNKVNGNLEIVFADTGTGITKEVMKKLWTPFFTTKAKGMGLGLSICKRIVEVHRGSIFVKTKVGEGTTFTITLPIEPKIEEGGEKIWINLPESLLSTTTKA